MVTTIAQAFTVLRARAEANISDRLIFPDEGQVLPDTPVPFVYFELVNENGAVIENGSGRGGNRFRNRAEFVAYVFRPRGGGMKPSLDAAETVAALFRSFRSDGVSCIGATVHPVGQGEALVPPGMQSAAGNYACAIVSIPLYFDQTA